MIKILLIIPLILVACASDPVELTGHTRQSGGFVAFATLSSDDSIEAASSVVYTQIARYNYTAAVLLRNKKITLVHARQARQVSVEIIDFLDDAVEKKNLLKIQSASKQILQALETLEETQ